MQILVFKCGWKRDVFSLSYSIFSDYILSIVKLYVKVDKNISRFRESWVLGYPFWCFAGGRQKWQMSAILCSEVTVTGLFVQQHFILCPLSQQMTSLRAHVEEADGDLCLFVHVRMKVAVSSHFEKRRWIKYSATLQLQNIMRPSNN